MQKIALPNEPILEPKMNAFAFQTEAFLAVKDLPYSAIFHEQGLGKTKIAIDLLLYWLGKKDIDTALVVTKKQLINNWVEELKMHTHLRPSILTNNRKDNFYVFNGPSRIIITNFETVLGENERFKLFLKARNVGIIIDESAKLKNPDSAVAKAFFGLSEFFVKKLIMTGTPVANRPYDIWAQIFFLDHGESLGKSFKEFKAKTDLTNDLSDSPEKQKDFEEAISSIQCKINKFSVRETKAKGLISLPQKEYINLWAEFEDRQKEIYDIIREEMLILVEKNELTEFDDSSASIKRLIRLVQVTSNPRLIDDMYFHTSGKEKVLAETLLKIIAKKEKCIVWSSFIENINYFSEKYCEYGTVKVHGGMKISDRIKSIKYFKEDPEVNVLFATPQSSKEGLTLTVANHVVFYDRNFSLDDYLQAQDRIHRISQEKTCYIYNIMVRDSIDEWIDNLLKAKQRAAQLSQGDVSLSEYIDTMEYSFGDQIKNILVVTKS
jgi:SNF2 family DNA or RNA helicase